MKKPVSFKGLLNTKDKPINSSVPRITQEEIEYKRVKNFVNKFKCPLCKCLLDGSLTQDFITLKCAWSKEHFVAGFNVVDKNNMLITYDQLYYLDQERLKRYIIYREFKDNNIDNRITIQNIDGNGDVIIEEWENFSLPGSLFDYNKLDKDKIKNLIKTVLIFS